MATMEVFGLAVEASWLVFPLIGCIAGLLAGLLGIGGGIILVPGLYFVFQRLGIAPEHEMQFAIATSLACIVPTSLSATWAHQRQKNIDWSIYKRLVPGFLLGGVAGGLLGDYLSSAWLEKVFGLLCIFIALRIFLGFKPDAEKKRGVSPVRHVLNGGLMGTLAAMTGVGGGALVNPYMLWIGAKMRYAVGTAAAAVVAISSCGSLTYLFARPDFVPSFPHIGYVIWPAVIGVAIFSMCFAPLGAKLAERLPTIVLKRLLAIILLVVAIKFLL